MVGCEGERDFGRAEWWGGGKERDFGRAGGGERDSGWDKFWGKQYGGGNFLFIYYLFFFQTHAVHSLSVEGHHGVGGVAQQEALVAPVVGGALGGEWRVEGGRKMSIRRRETTKINAMKK